MPRVSDVFVHEDHHCLELRRMSLEKLPAPPVADVCAGRITFNTASGHVQVVDATNTPRTVAYLEDISRNSRYVGVFDASTGTVPLAAAIPDVDGSTTLNAGDWFLVSVPGTLVPAPASGNALLQIGDLVYVTIDMPATNANFYTIDKNPDLVPNLMLWETLTVPVLGWVNTIPPTPFDPGEWTFTHNSLVFGEIYGYAMYWNGVIEGNFIADIMPGQIVLYTHTPPLIVQSHVLKLWGAAP